MKVAIITDQHGCEKEFRELIAKLELGSQDHLLAAGDLVHKGPDSAACVKYLRQLSGQHRVQLAFSNHEAKFRRFCIKYRVDPTSVRKMHNYEECENIYHQLNQDDFEFLDTAKVWLQVPGQAAIVIHGGIQPNVRELPAQKPIGQMTTKEIDVISHFWYCRYVRDGRMVHLGKERADDPFWADVYDGRFGFAYFGHQPYMQDSPRIFPHAAGLDLGCVQGGKLCAALIEGDDIKYVTVDGFEYVKSKNIYPE